MNDMTQTADPQSNTVALSARLVEAFISNPNNTFAASDIPSMISNIHSTLAGLGSPELAVEAAPAKREPVVSVRKSIANDDYIICLIDGQKLKMLKRHLMTSYGMTPDQYRAEFNLPADYPMTARNYTEQRRALAKKIGLGRLRSSDKGEQSETVAKVAKTVKDDAAPAKRRGRPKGSTNKPKAATAKKTTAKADAA